MWRDVKREDFKISLLLFSLYHFELMKIKKQIIKLTLLFYQLFNLPYFYE